MRRPEVGSAASTLLARCAGDNGACEAFLACAWADELFGSSGRARFADGHRHYLACMYVNTVALCELYFISHLRRLGHPSSVISDKWIDRFYYLVQNASEIIEYSF